MRISFKALEPYGLQTKGHDHEKCTNNLKENIQDKNEKGQQEIKYQPTWKVTES